MRDVGKKDEDESYDPFAGLDKGSVLQARPLPSLSDPGFCASPGLTPPPPLDPPAARGSPGAAHRAQETRLFNDPKVRDHGGTIRKCRLLMTQVLYMLGQVRSRRRRVPSRALTPGRRRRARRARPSPRSRPRSSSSA